MSIRTCQAHARSHTHTHAHARTHTHIQRGSRSSLRSLHTGLYERPVCQKSYMPTVCVVIILSIVLIGQSSLSFSHLSPPSLSFPRLSLTLCLPPSLCLPLSVCLSLSVNIASKQTSMSIVRVFPTCQKWFVPNKLAYRVSPPPRLKLTATVIR